MRVDDLIAKRSGAEIGSLGDVGELASGRLVNRSAWIRSAWNCMDGGLRTVNRPESTKDSEEAALTAYSRSTDSRNLS